MKNEEILSALKEVCKDLSKNLITAVVLGVDESIQECEGEYYGDLSEAVIASLKDDSLQSELTETLAYYEIWESENFNNVIACIKEGAIPEQIPKSTGLSQNSTLAELVIYAMKVSV